MIGGRTGWGRDAEQHPKSLSNVLDRVAAAEKRSKSYYIKESLELILRDRLEDLEDYEDAKQAYDAFVVSGEKAIPFEEMKKELNLKVNKIDW